MSDEAPQATRSEGGEGTTDPDRHTALAAEWAEWAHEDARSTRTSAGMSAVTERMNALLIRSRGAGLSYGEIAEMLSRTLTEAKGEDVHVTPEEVMAYMRDHVDGQHGVRRAMRTLKRRPLGEWVVFAVIAAVVLYLFVISPILIRTGHQHDPCGGGASDPSSPNFDPDCGPPNLRDNP